MLLRCSRLSPLKPALGEKSACSSSTLLARLGTLQKRSTTQPAPQPLLTSYIPIQVQHLLSWKTRLQMATKYEIMTRPQYMTSSPKLQAPKDLTLPLCGCQQNLFLIIVRILNPGLTMTYRAGHRLRHTSSHKSIDAGSLPKRETRSMRLSDCDAQTPLARSKSYIYSTFSWCFICMKVLSRQALIFCEEGSLKGF